MARVLTVSDSVVVNADALSLYELISDPTRMGAWSPENLGATLRGDRESAFLGMEFDGHNKRGRAQWTTRCTVTAADTGKLFEFRVHKIGLSTPRIPAAIATWQFRFSPVPGGTRVTETWTDDRRGWPDLAAELFDKVATGGKTFADFQRGNIRKTLLNFKSVVEQEVSGVEGSTG
ncbi:MULTISPECIES: SRPBCC family protein [unclassified Rhodococcus (in: high G+C Gram-positive bacteria)]|uniref:SRPBCC family protein n=1 Tax=unclassified Rhodococcus (in: high G+C Gram-positive bacteria) TaxID=192944 RepID=UPI0024B7156C|nr:MULTISPECIES: SRPBCC family protein [unclassified Rhodococcus (in: high G+C Gram-positive bacteria)]MDI9959995.1 SRPBCC family protein [Rhodococcus sp. IEGM 1237]MDI9965882.1 SRPBCC family protein [Rhodococcus sp. IEGM 1251]MDV8128133.1 SRPBCC family protein [Rhodococcus sp. IEGM 1304]